MMAMIRITANVFMFLMLESERIKFRFNFRRKNAKKKMIFEGVKIFFQQMPNFQAIRHKNFPFPIHFLGAVVKH